jgi:hypothetical protein
MNRHFIDRVANAVLYEGYVLYPYRPSVKTRHRWTFGGLYPEEFCRPSAGSEASFCTAECPVRGSVATTIEVIVRFLHLTARQVGRFERPLPSWSEREAAPFEPVETLRLGDQIFHTWQEAEEREIEVGELAIGAILNRPHKHWFAFPGRQRHESITEPNGTISGLLAREQQAIEGVLEISAVEVGEGLFRLSATVRNLTALEMPTSRDDALLSTLVSTHLVFGVAGGELVSVLDPPDDCREAAAACRNIGVWPVLVGEIGRTDAMLASPIILYDYPQIAAESPGDLFDGTEIDEILSLRILTLTEDEKRLASAVDERTRALLARTENLAAEDFFELHGRIRESDMGAAVHE